MTREETDSMLRRSITEAGEVAKNILAPQEARILGACVAGLALVLADQERRLRVLEGADGLDCGPESDADGNMRRRR